MKTGAPQASGEGPRALLRPPEHITPAGVRVKVWGRGVETRGMVEFGQACAQDIPRLAECWHALLDEAGLLPGGAVQDWRERLERWFADAMAAGWMRWEIARDGGVVVGTAAAVLREAPGNIARERSATLAGIFVERAYRRRGIARELTVRAIEWCRTHGCAVVYLQASDAGRPLYESLGFVPAPEMCLRLA